VLALEGDGHERCPWVKDARSMRPQCNTLEPDRDLFGASYVSNALKHPTSDFRE
jgi:hypothetical protein